MTYILGGARTPSGSFMGALSHVPATSLGAKAIASALERAAVGGEKVEEVVMGQVLPAGAGQAPARQAALGAGLSHQVPCVTVNKVCGSGLEAIIQGHRAIGAGDREIVVAGGMESMSRTPHLLMNSRRGVKFGQALVRDSMEWDGLWDVYSQCSMGECAEKCASKYGISREEQDEYAIESFKRAQKASREGVFRDEIVPVEGVEEDEGPFKAKFDKIPKLRPVFAKDGTITAANASTINDGAAALVLGGESYRSQAKFKIVAHASYAHDPTWFTTAPIFSLRKLFEKTGHGPEDIDLLEINEAFSVVVLAAERELKLDRSKVNIYGGGISLGHPIGCSGARILVTLMNGLNRTGGRTGVASLCIGGGEALSLLVQKV